VDLGCRALAEEGREGGREGGVTHEISHVRVLSLLSRVSLLFRVSLLSSLARALSVSSLSLLSRVSSLFSRARSVSLFSLCLSLIHHTARSHNTHKHTHTHTHPHTTHAHVHPPTCCLDEGSFSTSAHALDTHILEHLILAGRQQDAPLWIWGAGRLLRKGGREEGREGSHESSHVRVRNGGRCPASLPGSPPPHVQEAAHQAHGVEGMTRGGRPPASQRAGACSEHSSVGGSGLRPPLR
jgi:hypothetical protein